MCWWLIGLQSLVLPCKVDNIISGQAWFPSVSSSPRGHMAAATHRCFTLALRQGASRCKTPVLVSPDKKCLLAALQSGRSTLHLLTKEGGELFFSASRGASWARCGRITTSVVWSESVTRSAPAAAGPALLVPSVLSSWSKRATNYDIWNLDAGFLSSNREKDSLETLYENKYVVYLSI